MPVRAATLMGLAAAAMAAGLAYLKQAPFHPVDVTWLYTVNFLAVYGVQVGPILFFGAFALRPEPPYPRHAPRVRFLCLVPAYNEELVIQNSAGSLVNQEYPREMFEVYVVSDGSADRTEEIARALGARVLETGVDGFGKHRALGYAFERLLYPGDDRYVCVFDADNVVAPNFLQEMNNAICATGARCLQAFHDCLNGPDNWITKGLWITTAAAARLYNWGRSRALGVALICGTGWCCQAGLLWKYWPMIRTQTEDIELTGLLLLHEGVDVPWVPATCVYDEKPRNLWVAIRQRHRWMTGHMRVAWHLFRPCLREGFRRRDPRLVELALYYVIPFVMNLSNVQAFLLLGIFLGVFTLHGPLTAPAFRWGANIVTLCYLFGFQVVGFGLRTRLWGRAPLYSLYAAIFSPLAWTPALVWACFTVPRNDWIFHTPHVAGVEPAAGSAPAPVPAGAGVPRMLWPLRAAEPAAGGPGGACVSGREPAG